MTERIEDRETQERLKGIILDLVDKQIEEREYVRECFERLSQKYGRDEAREKISMLVSEQMYDIMNDRRYFDEEKYKSDLAALD